MKPFIAVAIKYGLIVALISIAIIIVIFIVSGNRSNTFNIIGVGPGLDVSSTPVPIYY